MSAETAGISRRQGKEKILQRGIPGDRSPGACKSAARAMLQSCWTGRRVDAHGLAEKLFVAASECLDEDQVRNLFAWLQGASERLARPVLVARPLDREVVATEAAP